MKAFAFVVKHKWWHGSNPQGGRIVFTGKKIFPSYLRGSGRKTAQSLSPSNGDFVRHHEEQVMVSLAEHKYGNEPRMSSIRSPTEMTCSA